MAADQEDELATFQEVETVSTRVVQRGRRRQRVEEARSSSCSRSIEGAGDNCEWGVASN